MERDVALDLLLDLVDVAVEHGDRPEALQIAESAGSVLGSPSPFLIDRPQRQMGKDDDRGARRQPFDVLLHPFELVVTELGEAGGFEARLEIEDVDQRDEMHPPMVETVPAFALSALAV